MITTLELGIMLAILVPTAVFAGWYAFGYLRLLRSMKRRMSPVGRGVEQDDA